MGNVLKFPLQASRLGYRRVSKRARHEDDPSQLQLFSRPSAQILPLTAALGSFEHALLLDEGRDPRAVELYHKAIDEGDCVADAYCNLGIIETNQGRTPKAFGYFTRSLEYNPRHFEAHYNLGNLYFDENELRLARFHYEMAAEIAPSFPSLYFNLALVLSLNNELAAAIAALIKYRELVTAEEGKEAVELLENLTRALAASQKLGRARSSIP
jgi:tetratricopeptide (TPR) repeat protein